MSLSINITAAAISADRFIIRGTVNGIFAGDLQGRMFIINYSLQPMKGSTVHPTNTKLGLKVIGVGGRISHEVEIPRYAGAGGPSRVNAIQSAMKSSEVDKILLNAVLYENTDIARIADNKSIDVTAEF